MYVCVFSDDDEPDDEECAEPPPDDQEIGSSKKNDSGCQSPDLKLAEQQPAAVDGEGYLDMSPTNNNNNTVSPTDIHPHINCVTAMDNPEYFDHTNMNSDDPVQIDDLKSHNKDPLRLRSVSSESASDPEYYNEYDKLNKDRKAVALANSATESAV